MSNGTLLRARSGRDSGRVGAIELLFDLVFVFAVTQLSHMLLEELTPSGALRTSMLLLAVWWVWIYTSWVTNWLDPERVPVRICLFVLLLAGLLLSASIPDAFGKRGLQFALAYVFMQVGRTLFFLWAVRGAEKHRRRNFQRILVWLSTSGACWIAGGLASGPARQGWWGLALTIEFLGPWMYFGVPGLGRSSIAEWDVDGSHLAERCGLFVIIALGESLLVTGATFARSNWNGEAIAGLLAAALGSIALWWIYFDTGAERANRRIRAAADPGRQARLAYTYLHLLIVAGVIVCAVGDDLVLAHPEHATAAGVGAILGGPLIYLVGVALFKWVTNDRRLPPLSHMVGVAMLLVVAPLAFGQAFSALQLGGLTTAILVFAAGWESVALARPARADR
jgi:low temperature requirement protein LtrA